MSEFSDKLLAAVAPYFSLSSGQLAALEAHFQLMTRWNAKLNLTAVRTLEEAVRVHYAECLYFGKLILEHWPDLATASLVDVGSGAGFPGVPLAVLHPDWTVTLVESHRRKAVFLTEATSRHPNLRVVAQRAEDLKCPFDLAVARAVTPSDVIRLRLAPRTALLVAESDVPRGTPAVALPWAPNRVAMFHVEQPKAG